MSWNQDHGIGPRESPAATGPSAVGMPFVPMAEAVPGAEGPGEFIPDPEDGSVCREYRSRRRDSRFRGGTCPTHA